MSIFAIINEALRIARTHKSLWLFGFLAGIGGGFDFGGGGGQEAIPPVAATPPSRERCCRSCSAALPPRSRSRFCKFLSTGALIEGVRRVRGNGTMTVREGFREGWAHWGVLFRITLVYLPMNIASVAVLVAACALVWRELLAARRSRCSRCWQRRGPRRPCPWLLTLYVWQRGIAAPRGAGPRSCSSC